MSIYIILNTTICSFFQKVPYLLPLLGADSEILQDQRMLNKTTNSCTIHELTGSSAGRHKQATISGVLPFYRPKLRSCIEGELLLKKMTCTLSLASMSISSSAIRASKERMLLFSKHDSCKRKVVPCVFNIIITSVLTY